MVNNDGVTARKEENYSYQCLTLGRLRPFQDIIQLFIEKAHVVFLWHYWSCSQSVIICAGGELFEFHDIAGKSSCFVGKDIFDLAELLVEITWLGSHLHVLIEVVHVYVIIHKHCLPEFHQLERNGEGYRYEISENEDPRTEDLEQGGVLYIQVICPLAFWVVNVFNLAIGCVFIHEHLRIVWAKRCTHDSENYLN